MSSGFAWPALVAAHLLLLAHAASAKVSISLGACVDRMLPSAAYLAAAKVALDEGYFDDILPGNASSRNFTVNLTTVDTQCSGTAASVAALPLLLGEGSVAGRIHSSKVDVAPVVGIAGCICSSASQMVASMATSYMVPVVSGGSTSPTLSDKGQYPYFARVIPPDSMQGNAFAALVLEFGWTRILSVYPASVYSQGVAGAFKSKLASSGGGVAYLEYQLKWQPLDTPADAKAFDHEAWQVVAQQIASETPPPRIFFSAGVLLDHMLRIMMDLGFVSNSTLWLLAEGVCNVDLLLQIAPKAAAYQAAVPNDPWWVYPWERIPLALKGMMCFLPQATGPKYAAPRFQDFFRGLTRNKLEAAGFSAATFGWDDSWLNVTSFNSIIYYPLQFDAMAVLFVAVGSLIARGLPATSVGGAALHDEIQAARFESITGLIGFDANGDRLAPYAILNMRVVQGTPSLVSVGAYDAMAQRITWSSVPVFADGTTNPPPDRPPPCAPGSELGGILTGCTPCAAGRVSQGEGSRCLACLPGYFQAAAGQSVCAASPKGMYVKQDGAAAALNCSAGQFAQERASTACDRCAAGTWAALPGVSACEAAPPGSYVGGEGATAAVSCPEGTFSAAAGESECTRCLEGSLQSRTGATSCESCGVGFYSVGGKCKSCGFLRTTPGPGQPCLLSPFGIGVIVVGAVVVALACAALALVIVKLRRRMFKYEAERERHMQETVMEGLKTLRKLGHPMVLVRMTDFLGLSWEQLGGLHEGVRNMGKLLHLDTLDHVRAARKKGMKVLFFSYQWLSWERSGPDQVQFRWMQRATEEYAMITEVDPAKLCIWLDVLAIPQANEDVKKLAVNSLYTYATAADALIIIAPESRHENTGCVANLDTYKSRIWTRAEQVAHLSCHDISTVFFATERGLEQITMDWVREIIHVFDAEMTCCRLKHKGMMHCDKESLVLPLLGLWYTLRAQHCGYMLREPGDAGGELLYSLMEPQTDLVFPRTFQYSNRHGTETRTLFGDGILRVEAFIKRQQRGLLVDILATDSFSFKSTASPSAPSLILPTEFDDNMTFCPTHSI